MYYEPTTHSREITPAWVAGVVGGMLHPPVAPALDLAWDSRNVGPGTGFVALPGERTHGREFAKEALGRGAAWVLTDRAHPGAIQVKNPYQALIKLGRAFRDRFKGKLVAVGGSSGKTTTKEALAQGLGWPAPKGNLNTPAALARFFWHLEEPGEGAVVELGIDRLGEMDELVTLAAPNLGLITTLGAEHLDGLGCLENVVNEESKLLRTSNKKLASVQAAKFLDLPGLKTYGFEAGDFAGENLELKESSSRFVFGEHTVTVPYPGVGPALGALAALAVAAVLGKNLAEVAERLSALTLPPGRMERVVAGGVSLINDAYNSNPASVSAGMEYLKRQPGRKWVVLGEMKELGKESEKLHLEAAHLAKQASDCLIFLGSHAEAQAREAGGNYFSTQEEVLEFLLANVQAGDLVYLKASRSVGLDKLFSELVQALERWQP